MPKSSIDYEELHGLRVFISHYKSAFEAKYGTYSSYDVNKPAGPQAVLSTILDRIAELERK
jgi:hypothetical protein